MITTDAELCRRWRDDRDTEALHSLIERYDDAIHLSIFRSRVMQRGDSADEYKGVAVECAVALFGSFRPGRGMKLLSYLLQWLPRHIARRVRTERGPITVTAHAHDQGVRLRAVPIVNRRAYTESGEQSGYGISESALPGPRREPGCPRLIALREALAEMDPADRTLLAAKMAGTSHREIGEWSGVTREPARQRVLAAMASLRARALVKLQESAA